MADGNAVAGDSDAEIGEPAEDDGDFTGLALGQDGEEFIAAEAPHDIGAARGAAEGEGKCLENVVAGGMAMLVVHALKTIEIEKDDGQRRGTALTTRDFL